MHRAHFRYSVTVFCKMVTNKPGKTTSGETQARQLVISPRKCLFFFYLKPHRHIFRYLHDKVIGCV